MLKVAILSSWHVHAMEYAELFNENSDATITCVWDEDIVKGQEFADELGVPFEADLDLLLARPDVDAVCVNAPTNMHEEVIVKAANAKKHIFTEKVLAVTLPEAMAIKAAVEENNVKFTICFPHKTMPRNLFAKRVLEAGLLGQVTYLRVRNAHGGASDGWLPDHFYNQEQCGGGAMIDLGAHPMYLINWFLGMPESVSSAFTYVTGKAVEDNAVTIMKYADGLIAVSETGFVSGSSAFVLEIHGTQGSLTINDNDISLQSSRLIDSDLYNGVIKPQELPEELDHPVDNFIAGVLHDEAIVDLIDDAVVLTKLMVAAYKSHETGGFVTV